MMMVFSMLVLKGRLPLLQLLMPALLLMWLLGTLLIRPLPPWHWIRRAGRQRSTVMVWGRGDFIRPGGRERVRSESAIATTVMVQRLVLFLRWCQVTVTPSLAVWLSVFFFDVVFWFRPWPHQVHTTM